MEFYVAANRQLAGIASPAAPARSGWDQESKRVFVNGKSIGTANNQAGADALVKRAEIDFLKKNPEKAPDFDERHGFGQAAKILGRESPVAPAAGPAAAPDATPAAALPKVAGTTANAAESDAGAAVDAARIAHREALEKLQAFGLVKQKMDPTSYRAAQQALEDTTRQLGEAQAAWTRTVGGAGDVSRPARFVTPP
jgi:hypothetical protein